MFVSKKFNYFLKEMKTLQKQESQWYLYFKLFIIMGITWTVEIGHGLWHGNHTDRKNYYLSVEVILSFN